MKIARGAPQNLSSYDAVKARLESSSSIRLLRSDNAALAISFFFCAFKAKNHQILPESQLVSELTVFLDEIRERFGDSYERTATEYLNYWCEEKQRFLRKYYGLEHDEPVLELTYDTERVLEWVLSLEKRDFVGTESRFLLIIEALRKLVYETSIDPEKRLIELKRQRDSIDVEIREIEGGTELKILSATQVRERFALVDDETRRLVTDFRMVEQNFREIADGIKKQQLKATSTKGQVLGFALDSSDALDESDQGKSFQGFWEFLRSDPLQEELKDLVDRVLKLSEVIEILEKRDELGTNSLRKFKFNLMDAARRVSESNRLFTEQIRKLLHEKNIQEDRLAKDLIVEIKRMAADIKPIEDKGFIEIESGIAFSLPMERPLWATPNAVRFTAAQLETHNLGLETMDPAALLALTNRFYIDRSQLKKRIEVLLRQHSQISLKQVLDVYPIEKGLAEVIAYVALALEDKRSVISDQESESILVSGGSSDDPLDSRLRVPKIIFVGAVQ